MALEIKTAKQTVKPGRFICSEDVVVSAITGELIGKDEDHGIFLAGKGGTISMEVAERIGLTKKAEKAAEQVKNKAVKKSKVEDK